MKGEAAET